MCAAGMLTGIGAVTTKGKNARIAARGY